MRFALEPKPNEPRRRHLPADGGAHAALHLHPRRTRTMVGVNPEVAHEHHGGTLLRARAVAQAMECGQAVPHRPERASASGATTRTCALARRTSNRPSSWCASSKARAGVPAPTRGRVHFDAHAYRSEDEAGVWDFARGLHAHATRSSSTKRAKAFDADPEVQPHHSAAHRREPEPQLTVSCYSRANAARRPGKPLGGMDFDVDGPARRAGCATNASTSSCSSTCWGRAADRAEHGGPLPRASTSARRAARPCCSTSWSASVVVAGHSRAAYGLMRWSGTEGACRAASLTPGSGRSVPSDVTPCAVRDRGQSTPGSVRGVGDLRAAARLRAPGRRRAPRDPAGQALVRYRYGGPRREALSPASWGRRGAGGLHRCPRSLWLK